MSNFYRVMFFLNLVICVGIFAVFLWQIVSATIDENPKDKARHFTRSYIFLAIFLYLVLIEIALGHPLQLPEEINEVVNIEKVEN